MAFTPYQSSAVTALGHRAWSHLGWFVSRAQVCYFVKIFNIYVLLFLYLENGNTHPSYLLGLFMRTERDLTSGRTL